MSSTLLHTALAVGGIIVGITATLALTPSVAPRPSAPVPRAKNTGYVLPPRESSKSNLVLQEGGGKVIVPGKIGASFFWWRELGSRSSFVGVLDAFLSIGPIADFLTRTAYVTGPSAIPSSHSS